MTFLVFILVYLVFLIGVGLWKIRDVRTQEDFMVAGRRLTTPVLVGTLLATWTGSGSLFNGGRLGYENGFAALWSAGGAWIGIAVIYFVAQKVRKEGKLSIPHILEHRYNHQGRDHYVVFKRPGAPFEEFVSPPGNSPCQARKPVINIPDE